MSISASAEQQLQKTESTWDKPGSLDAYLTNLCLYRTIGEVNKLREQATNARAYFGCNLVWNCIWGSDGKYNPDISCIKTIIKRIDGTVPDKETRDGYANLIGDAIEDVLDYENDPRAMVIQADDLAIVALAKVIVNVANRDVGKNIQARKDRATAIDIILERTGGKQTEPVKEVATVAYIEPAWMLPDEETYGRLEQGEGHAVSAVPVVQAEVQDSEL